MQHAKFKRIEPVLITDIPEEKTGSGVTVAEVTNNIMERLDAIQDEPEEKDDKVRILVTIKMSSCFQIHRSNIDYRTLLVLVEKMEALC